MNENFKREVENWQHEGIINSSQAQAILSKYGLATKPKKILVDNEKEEDKHTELITVISIIGAILIGLGIIVFVASNWQRIPAFLKLILLFGGTFGTYFAGWSFENNRRLIIGGSLLFLGSLFVGATIFLTAQIFHVQANVHWLLLIWFIAIAPLSYGFESKPTLILSLFIFALWLPSFMASNARSFGMLTGYFNNFGVFLFYGLTLFGIGYLHEKTKFSEFKTSYQSFGLFFTLAILYASIVSELEIIRNIGDHWLVYIFLVLALISVITSSFLFGSGKGKKQEFSWNILAFIMAIGLWLLSLIADNLNESYLFPILIIYHILFFILIFITFMTGYHQKVASFINIGLLFFVLYIGYFYFTTVFRYLPKSLALVIGGVILVIGGWYLEKKRREIMEEIGEK